ncbi:MAG: nuclear transport factor 2 family protein [Bacteroidetes bacterium]|nr:nuclear transport factor 2 family protein [Bacteroidota bacterium]
MKTKFIVLIIMLIGAVSSAQTERERVIHTLNDYIEGSSYNKLELLESAFTENATLYLTVKGGEFKSLTPKEYVSFFKGGEPDSYNGRIGKILSVEVSGEIATAKVEILFTKSDWRYIDLFLLKKTDAGWKIISKTAAGQAGSNKRGDHILLIVSNAQYYGNTDLKTGNSFSEIVKAYATFSEAGYTVDFVSPNGGAIPVAYVDTSDDTSKKQLYNEDFMYAMKYTLSPSQVDPSKYKAVQYIGGGSAMFGVPENTAIQQIAMEVYEEHNGIISSVCHGSAGIVNLKKKDGSFLVAGKKVSGYPDAFEAKDRPHYDTFPFKITQTLESRGAIFTHGDRNTAYVETDGRLVTGQNWLSSRPVALKIIELLTISSNQ